MLVDLPGYGYAEASKAAIERWTGLVRRYLRSRASLRRVCLLIDSRHGIKEPDRPMLRMLDQAGISYQLILTKTDKLLPASWPRPQSGWRSNSRHTPPAHPEIHLTSAEKKRGIEALRATLAAFASSSALAPARDGGVRATTIECRPLMSPNPNPWTTAVEPNPQAKATVLAEALPYMRRYAGHTLVVKYGGHAMGDGGRFVRP